MIEHGKAGLLLRPEGELGRSQGMESGGLVEGGPASWSLQVAILQVGVPAFLVLRSWSC